MFRSEEENMRFKGGLGGELWERSEISAPGLLRKKDVAGSTYKEPSKNISKFPHTTVHGLLRRKTIFKLVTYNKQSLLNSKFSRINSKKYRMVTYEHRITWMNSKLSHDIIEPTHRRTFKKRKVFYTGSTPQWWILRTTRRIKCGRHSKYLHGAHAVQYFGPNARKVSSLLVYGIIERIF